MSLQNKIERRLKEIATINQIEPKLITVKEETVLTERKYKREKVYIVKIQFYKGSNIPLDYFFVFYYFFIIRFKVYRCYYGCNDSSFNFHLKERRNMNVLKDIIRD